MSSRVGRIARTLKLHKTERGASEREKSRAGPSSTPRKCVSNQNLWAGRFELGQLFLAVRVCQGSRKTRRQNACVAKTRSFTDPPLRKLIRSELLPQDRAAPLSWPGKCQRSSRRKWKPKKPRGWS